MNRQSSLYWSFPIGTWFYTQVRVSVCFPLLILVLCYRIDNLQLGLVFSAILLFSVLMHELGHIWAVRVTGGIGAEILIWPLGGLAFVRPAGTFSSQFLTAAAGPIVNLILCMVTIPGWWSSYDTQTVLNPLVMPIGDISNDVIREFLVLIFAANWVLLLVNLIPVFPLDGGRMLQAWLSSRMGSETGAEIYIRIGFVFAFVMMIGGLLIDGDDFNGIWVVVIGSILLVLNMQESFQLRSGERYDESFMGYDFSQGYTSLERTEETPSQLRRGLLQQWRDRRRAEHKQVEVELQLDALLEKVHTQGLGSLTASEKRKLNRASDWLRDRQKQDE